MVPPRKRGRPLGSGVFTERLHLRLRDGDTDLLTAAFKKANRKGRFTTMAAWLRQKLGLQP